jgi:hypothetical protein
MALATPLEARAERGYRLFLVVRLSWARPFRRPRSVVSLQRGETSGLGGQAGS